MPPDHRPIDVVFFTGTLRTGGSETHVVRLASRLDRARVRPSILLLQRVADGPLIELARAASVPVHDLAVDAGVRGVPGSLVRLYRTLRRLRPDVLHSYGYPCDVYAPLVGRLLPDLHVVTTRRGRQPFPRRRAMYRLTNPLADRVLCVSEAMRRFARDTDGLRMRSSEVIANGVDVARFDGGDERDGAIRTIGAIGRIAPVKGQDLLLAAFERLRGRDLRLAIAGPPAETWGRDLMRRHRGRDDVRFVGDVDDVPRFLRSIDLFVLPSRSEGMSMALLEAMATGLPIVATDVDSNAEVLDGGQAGVLVEPTADGLARGIADLLEHPGRAAALGRAARRRAETEYSLETMVSRYESFYARLVSEGDA